MSYSSIQFLELFVKKCLRGRLERLQFVLLVVMLLGWLTILGKWVEEYIVGEVLDKQGCG